MSLKIQEKFLFEIKNILRVEEVTSISTISEVKTSNPVTIQPTQADPRFEASKPQQIIDETPTQVAVHISNETPTPISVSTLQPIPPPRIPPDTENTAPYPVSNLPYPVDSPHKIPIAGQFE